jgi:hypothetical protein
VGFGRACACAPVRCAHPSFLVHCLGKRGAARPPTHRSFAASYSTPKNIYNLSNLGRLRQGLFFLSTEAMKYEFPCPCPAHRSFADPSGNIFAVKLCFLYFNCLLYDRHAYQCYTHIRHSEGFFEGAKPYLIHWGPKL